MNGDGIPDGNGNPMELSFPSKNLISYGSGNGNGNNVDKNGNDPHSYVRECYLSTDVCPVFIVYHCRLTLTMGIGMRGNGNSTAGIEREWE